MPVDFKHKEYTDNISTWQMIDDAVNKTNLSSYLRELNPLDTSEENKLRNEAYKKYAVYYNLAGMTLSGLVGELYSKEPEINLPASLAYLLENADGHGNSISQLSRLTSREVTKKGRDGIFTTFPHTDKPVSRADIQRGVRATMTNIDASRIINWEESTVGGVHQVTLIVFTESIHKPNEDGFGYKKVDGMRELRIENGVYVDRKWVKNNKGEWIVLEGSEKRPLTGSGHHWDTLPFKFVGSQNNDSSVDTVNMSDLSEIGFSLYRNSADYEDSVWFVGQAQAWMSGMDQERINLINSNKIYIGSRNMMPVPEGGQFGFASASPNLLVRQAMLDKIDLALGLGARFIKPGGVAKTAEQASGEQRVAHSILGMIGSNVSAAYEDAIGHVAKYMGADDQDIKFKLNADFVSSKATPAELKEIIAGYTMGNIPEVDYIKYMQKNEVIDPLKTTEQVQEELAQSSK